MHTPNGMPSSGTNSTTSPPWSVYVIRSSVTTTVPCPTQSSGRLPASSGNIESSSTVCGGASHSRPSTVTGFIPQCRRTTEVVSGLLHAAMARPASPMASAFMLIGRSMNRLGSLRIVPAACTAKNAYMWSFSLLLASLTGAAPVSVAAFSGVLGGRHDSAEPAPAGLPSCRAGRQVPDAYERYRTRPCPSWRCRCRC